MQNDVTSIEADKAEPNDNTNDSNLSYKQLAKSFDVDLRLIFTTIGLAAVIAAGLGWPQRAQVPDAVLGRVGGSVDGGDSIHGAARTEAGGGDGGSGAEMRDHAARTELQDCTEMRDRTARMEMRCRAARTEAGGGGGCSGTEMREQAEHVIAVMDELLEQC